MIIVAKDQGPTPDLINAKCTRNVSSSSEEGEEEEENEEEEKEEDHAVNEGRKCLEDEEDDGNVDDDRGMVFRDKFPERLSAIENGIKLSGPVTDL